MRVNGTAAYSTAIASVNNRNATPPAAPSQSTHHKNHKKAVEAESLPAHEQKAALFATIETSGRNTTLSPLIADKNLPPQTRNALTSYVNIQNQLHSDKQIRNQNLFGIDLFA